MIPKGLNSLNSLNRGPSLPGNVYWLLPRSWRSRVLQFDAGRGSPESLTFLKLHDSGAAYSGHGEAFLMTCDDSERPQQPQQGSDTTRLKSRCSVMERTAYRRRVGVLGISNFSKASRFRGGLLRSRGGVPDDM